MNRRDFLKKMGVASSAFLFPFKRKSGSVLPSIRLGRVASESLSIYDGPTDYGRILFQRYRDDILHIYDTVKSDDGPGYNPYWHRVWGGYVHSAFVQNVKNQLNPLITEFPSSGLLMELTVPYSKSYRYTQNKKWEEFYMLYYSSTHWVFDVVDGPDGTPWYKISDGLLTLSYYVPAEHLRAVTAEELTPIHGDVDPKAKRIEISIDFQSLRAYENNALVNEFLVSTGLPSRLSGPDIIPTDTPKGDHIVRAKRPSVHMGDGTLRSDAEAYELPGVPWVSYFVPTTGVAIHGAYWHNNFGVTMSHGCINMQSEDAKWIYRWSSPYPDESITNYHTPVDVI